jgi:hypothetical protein
MSLEHLDNLAGIQKVETPDFLFAKIQQKIEQSRKETLPKSTVTLLIAACCLLLGANIFVMVDFMNPTEGTKPPTEWILINPPNDLY